MFYNHPWWFYLLVITTELRSPLLELWEGVRDSDTAADACVTMVTAVGSVWLLGVAVWLTCRVDDLIRVAINISQA